jgi:hypothetical protein
MPSVTTHSPPVRAGRASRVDQCRSAMCCCSYLERSPVEFTLKVDARDCEGKVYAVPVVNPPRLNHAARANGSFAPNVRHSRPFQNPLKAEAK